MARRNPLRSWLAAALSIAAVMTAGLFTVQPGPAGAAEQKSHYIVVSEAGFSPPVVPDVNVGDVLVFQLSELPETTEKHTVTFEDNSVCPGARGAVPCWPELRFDDDRPNCVKDGNIMPRWRCMFVRDPGKTVRYYDAAKPANAGEIRVLGQTTTTTGPATTTTTAPASTTSTTHPATSTTFQTTTTTAPTQLRPFVIQDPGPTTSTMAPATPVTVTTGGTPATSASKDKGKAAKVKSAAVETPTTAATVPSDALPPDSVFDQAALTPGPIELPDASGDPADGDEVDLESAAVMNLLDSEEAADHRALLLVLGALTFLLFVGSVWAWFHRASRYDPA